MLINLDWRGWIPVHSPIMPSFELKVHSSLFGLATTFTENPANPFGDKNYGLGKNEKHRILFRN